MDYQTKPRVWIEVRPGRDFANRSNNLWVAVNPFCTGSTHYFGMVMRDELREEIR